MPPKVKTTKEDIIAAALEIVRQHGHDALNARSIASALGCSTQPIFSNFNSMEELELAVVVAAAKLCQTFVAQEQARGQYPLYKASGMGYIRFAREESRLFQMLYMRDRSEYIVTEDGELLNSMYDIVHSNIGLEQNRAQMFHNEMWAFVHGIASMLATGFQQLSEELISQMLTDVFRGLCRQFEEER